MRSESGQGIAEWVVLIFFIGMIVGLIFVGSQVSSILETVGTSVQA